MFAQKKKSIISGKTFALIVIILFAAGYFINTYDFGGKEDDNLTAGVSGEPNGEEETAEAGTLVSTEPTSGTITKNTQLLMRIYDQITNTTKTQELVMPSEVIGKTFEEAGPILLSKYEGSTVKEINESYTLLYKVIEKTQQVTTEDPTQLTTGETEPQTKESGYYLIREDQGLIKVYECDADGNTKLLRTTSISIHFLGDADQELFHYGVIKHTMDEVNELLQDFES